jgi:hypothetical protein
VPEPIGPLHAVRASGIATYGKARAVCGTDVDVIEGGHWPPSIVGREGSCWNCERLTS